MLHSEGNRLVLQKEFQRAAEKYQEAVICLRNLQAKVGHLPPSLLALPWPISPPLGKGMSTSMILHWVGEAMGGRLAEAGEPGHTAGAQLLPVSTGAGRVLRGAGAHHGAAPETPRYPYALSAPHSVLVAPGSCPADPPAHICLVPTTVPRPLDSMMSHFSQVPSSTMTPAPMSPDPPAHRSALPTSLRSLTHRGTPTTSFSFLVVPSSPRYPYPREHPHHIPTPMLVPGFLGAPMTPLAPSHRQCQGLFQAGEGARGRVERARGTGGFPTRGPP